MIPPSPGSTGPRNLLEGFPGRFHLSLTLPAVGGGGHRRNYSFAGVSGELTLWACELLDRAGGGREEREEVTGCPVKSS